MRRTGEGGGEWGRMRRKQEEETIILVVRG